MSRRITLALICATLTVVIVLAIVVVSAKGQTTAATVKGFPFVQVGQKYQPNLVIEAFKITKDLGNGWVATESSIVGTMFVNLNQVSALIPQ